MLAKFNKFVQTRSQFNWWQRAMNETFVPLGLFEACARNCDRYLRLCQQWRGNSRETLRGKLRKRVNMNKKRRPIKQLIHSKIQKTHTGFEERTRHLRFQRIGLCRCINLSLFFFFSFSCYSCFATQPWVFSFWKWRSKIKWRCCVWLMGVSSKSSKQYWKQ